MKRWRRRHLPPDGDIIPRPVGGELDDTAPPADGQSDAILPESSTPPEPVDVLSDTDRYRLMLRFNLTASQVERLDVDIARSLLGLLR